VCLQHCLLHLLIDIAAFFAGCLGLVTQLLKLVHAFHDGLLVLRLQLLLGLARLLVQLLDTVLQVRWNAAARLLACLTSLLYGLLDLRESLPDFLCLHHVSLLSLSKVIGADRL
jgi:hypothetical protein